MGKTWQEWLGLAHPVTGRKIKEDGNRINVADTEYSRSLLESFSVVARKQGYFFQDLRENVSNGDVYYYRLKAPSDKHIVIYAREISSGEGPVRFETVVLPDSFTAGTIVTPTNLYTGGAPGTSEFEKGVIPVGGITIPADFIFGAGNKSGTAGGSASLPTIIPPNVEIFAKITNEAAGTNPGIRFALAFAEIDIPDIIVI